MLHLDDNELVITRAEFIRLKHVEDEVKRIQADRDSEREHYDFLVQRRGPVHAIFRTADGLEVWHREKDPAMALSLARTDFYQRIPRTNLSRAFGEGATLPVRRVRTYQRTDERICGVPVWEEVVT